MRVKTSPSPRSRRSSSSRSNRDDHTPNYRIPRSPSSSRNRQRRWSDEPEEEEEKVEVIDLEDSDSEFTRPAPSSTRRSAIASSTFSRSSPSSRPSRPDSGPNRRELEASKRRILELEKDFEEEKEKTRRTEALLVAAETENDELTTRLAQSESLQSNYNNHAWQASELYATNAAEFGPDVLIGDTTAGLTTPKPNRIFGKSKSLDGHIGRPKFKRARHSPNHLIQRRVSASPTFRSQNFKQWPQSWSPDFGPDDMDELGLMNSLAGAHLDNFSHDSNLGQTVSTVTIEPDLDVLSKPSVFAHLDSGLQNPTSISNLNQLASWCTDLEKLNIDGLKQKWLLAQSVSDWWKALKAQYDFRPDTSDAILYRLQEICADKKELARAAMNLTTQYHPGFSIHGQVFSLS